jgi:hypothetical protein
MHSLAVQICVNRLMVTYPSNEIRRFGLEIMYWGTGRGFEGVRFLEFEMQM